MAAMMQIEKMQIQIYDSNQAVGQAAADDLKDILASTIIRRGEAAIILATGNSQLSFLNALRAESGIQWDKITVFQMDEYLGISDQHVASFRRYHHVHLVDVVHPRIFYGIDADRIDIKAEIARYTALLEHHEPVACVMGIGENGHLAFNDPPADFATDKLIHVVTLVEAARRQQVGEGHFASLDQVPHQALTLTVPALLKPPHLLVVVPELRKALAVQAALEGPVTVDCPASILRRLPSVKLYLDQDSASLLTTGHLHE